jgi:hypothetical protein
LHWIWLEIITPCWIGIASTRLIGAALITCLGHFETGCFHQLGNALIWNFFPFATAQARRQQKYSIARANQS